MSATLPASVGCPLPSVICFSLPTLGLAGFDCRIGHLIERIGDLSWNYKCLRIAVILMSRQEREPISTEKEPSVTSAGN